MSTIILKVLTIPDVDAGRAIHDLGDLSEDGIFKAMMHLQHQRNGTEFLPLHQHRIVAISVISLHGATLTINSLGEISDESLEFPFIDEAELLKALAELLDDSTNIISWDGQAFDLPVIGYRLLHHGISCPSLWKYAALEAGLAHCDLKKTLAQNNPTAEALLPEIALTLGLPGRLGFQPAEVLAHYQSETLADIKQACDADVLNIYMIYRMLQQATGRMSSDEYLNAGEQLKQQLETSKQAHLENYAALCWTEQQ